MVEELQSVQTLREDFVNSFSHEFKTPITAVKGFAELLQEPDVTEAERREWAARLWDAVEGLDEPDRTLFLRYYYYGDKLKDIARALGLTQTAAKQRLFRGRKALRDTLTKGGVEA